MLSILKSAKLSEKTGAERRLKLVEMINFAYTTDTGTNGEAENAIGCAADADCDR